MPSDGDVTRWAVLSSVKVTGIVISRRGVAPKITNATTINTTAKTERGEIPADVQQTRQERRKRPFSYGLHDSASVIVIR
jgi:hypothetical protein